jgi:tRNA A37 threonylcarbamoyladenosine dehydratase
MSQFSRTERLFGREGMNNLSAARVAIFGIGGVGGCAAEALARSGIGAIDLIDDDRVMLSNLNRQIIALHSTVGRIKVDVMKERLLDINPRLSVVAHPMFYLPETADGLDLSVYDYIIDAVDTVKAKLELVCRAVELKVPIISAMGAGNKLDPARLKVADIYDTSACPLARVMRGELRKRGIKGLKVVYSTEEALAPKEEEGRNRSEDDVYPPGVICGGTARRAIPGSTAFVPPAMGLLIAAEVVRDITFKSGIRG